MRDRDRAEIQDLMKKQRATLYQADELEVQHLLFHKRSDVRALRAGGTPVVAAAAAAAATATPLRQRPSARPPHLFSVGTVVVVAKCTIPDQPLRLGGIVRVQTLHADGTYDVRYTVNSGGERDHRGRARRRR
jgi:hypothetical protein